MQSRIYPPRIGFTSAAFFSFSHETMEGLWNDENQQILKDLSCLTSALLFFLTFSAPDSVRPSSLKDSFSYFVFTLLFLFFIFHLSQLDVDKSKWKLSGPMGVTSWLLVCVLKLMHARSVLVQEWLRRCGKAFRLDTLMTRDGCK